MKALNLLCIVFCYTFISAQINAQSIDEVLQQKNHAKNASRMSMVCIGSATNVGTITPTSTPQIIVGTTGVVPSWTFTALAGKKYIFSTCGSTIDTQLEIFQGSTSVFYVDDNGPLCSGTASSMEWTCSTSGTYSILLARYNCLNLTTNVNMQYYFTDPPSITNVTPNQGVPGDLVTITGTGFINVTSVSLNNASAFFTVINAQTIQAYVPSGATTGKIFVVASGSSTTTVLISPSDFAVLPLGPLVYNFTPLQGPVGTTVTVRGKSFTGATAVQLNGQNTTYNVTNDSTLTFTVPAGATTGKVRVAVGTSADISTANFTVGTCVPPIVTVTGTGPYTITATGGLPPYSYSVNGSAFTSNNIIFSTQTVNTVIVRDAVNCNGTLTFGVSPSVGCDTTIYSGGLGTTYRSHSLGSGSGIVTINYDFYPIPDRMDVFYNGATVATTGGLVSGKGTLAFSYPGTGPSSYTIRMFAPLQGTLWQYYATCAVPCNIIVDQLSVTGTNSYQFNVTGGIPPYTFRLNGGPPQTSNVFNNLASGPNSLQISDSQNPACTKTHTFNIGSTVQCSGTATSGGQGTTFSEIVFLGSSAGTVNINYDMYSIPDQMDVLFNGNLVATTGGLVSGSSTLSFFYPGSGGSNSCVVRMYAPNSGTAWDYQVLCPVPTGIDESEVRESAISRFKIYPNPSNSFVNIDLGEESVNAITLYDALGRKHLKLKNPSGIIQLNNDPMISGIYTLTIEMVSGEIATRKIIFNE